MSFQRVLFSGAVAVNPLVKKFSFLLILVVTLFGPSQTFAQRDVAVFVKTVDNQTTIIPWATVTMDDGIFLDIRHDYDWPNTLAFFGGKAFAVGSVTLIPALGWLDAGYEGVSPELYVIGNINKLSYVTLWQAAMSTGPKDLPDFYYHWGNFTYPVTPWFSLGLGEQYYYENSNVPYDAFDIGPAGKITYKGFYFAPWYTWSATPGGENKLFLGFGKVF